MFKEHQLSFTSELKLESSLGVSLLRVRVSTEGIYMLEHFNLISR